MLQGASGCSQIVEAVEDDGGSGGVHDTQAILILIDLASRPRL